MAMTESGLKSVIKPKLTALYQKCNTGAGISDDEFADEMAGIIAAVVPYIQSSAQVPVGDLWAAGSYPVQGGPTKVL
jgi:hypothetical protein